MSQVELICTLTSCDHCYTVYVLRVRVIIMTGPLNGNRGTQEVVCRRLVHSFIPVRVHIGAYRLLFTLHSLSFSDLHPSGLLVRDRLQRKNLLHPPE